MSPPRSPRSLEQLRESYAETLDALRRRFEQLEAAVAQFPPDLDEGSFSEAWSSPDPGERNRADLVLASFEKTYMLLMDLTVLGVKIGRRLGVPIEDGVGPLPALRGLGVLSRGDEEALEVQREVRNASQHVYIEFAVPDLLAAVRRQLESSPRTIHRVAAWVESLGTDDCGR